MLYRLIIKKLLVQTKAEVMIMIKNSIIVNITGIAINLFSIYLILSLIFYVEKVSQKLSLPVIFEIKTPLAICISLAIGVTASNLLTFTHKNSILTKIHILSILLLTYILTIATVLGILILIIESGHVSQYLSNTSVDKVEIYVAFLVPIVSLIAFVSALRSERRHKI